MHSHQLGKNEPGTNIKLNFPGHRDHVKVSAQQWKFRQKWEGIFNPIIGMVYNKPLLLN